jgi:hypothetical protein
MPARKVGHDVAPDLLLVLLLDPVSPTGDGDGGRWSSEPIPHNLDQQLLGRARDQKSGGLLWERSSPFIVRIGLGLSLCWLGNVPRSRHDFRAVCPQNLRAISLLTHSHLTKPEINPT